MEKRMFVSAMGNLLNRKEKNITGVMEEYIRRRTIANNILHQKSNEI
ncbi:hypothetical protein [Candidatus Vidania fulgoroideorum]